MGRMRKPLTNISVRVHDEIPSRNKNKNPYQSVFDKIRAAANDKESEYDVVTSNDFQLSQLPVKSNLFHSGPLRAKPPSDDIIQVSPSPQDFDNTDVDLQYGVSNPHWYSNQIQASTAGYGPDDFIVETVNLDKNFFYQFFTSKPMIIDTDVVTSTSVQVKYDQKKKKGRDTELFKKGRETLMNLPEHLLGKEILPNHILKKMGKVATDEDSSDYSDVSDEDQNSSKYKRYHIPPEIQITHSGTPFRSGKELEEKSTEGK